MPDPQMSVDDFAGKIKAKYPDYANISNDSLVAAVVAKHPEYRDQVNFAPNAGLASPGAPPKVQMQEQPMNGAQSALAAMGNTYAANSASSAKVNSAIGEDAGQILSSPSTYLGPMVGGGIDAVKNMPSTLSRLRDFASSGNTPQEAPLAERLGGAAGINVEGVKRDAQQGNTEGIVGHSVLPIAMSILSGRAMGGAKTLPEGVNEGRTLGSSAVDSIIRPSVRDYNFGKNPGGQIPAEGIVAATQEGLLKKIGDKKREVGAQAADQLKGASGTQINVEPLIDGPIDNAVKRAAASNDQVLVDKLEGIRNSLKQDLVVGADGKITSNGAKQLVLNPAETNKLKQQIGEDTKWNGVDPHAEELNSTRVQIYRQLDKAIDGTSPGVVQLNDRYANLLTAEKALSRANDMRQKHDFVSMKDTIAAGAAGGATLLAGHSTPEALTAAIAIGLMRHGMESTAAKTLAARMIRSRAPGSAVGSLAGATVPGIINGQTPQPVNNGER